MAAKEECSKDKGTELPAQAMSLPFVNWLEENVVNKVRNQGECDCCWAIVACGAIESLYNINNRPKELFQLAPQELINCVKKEFTWCYPCSINEGFRYAKQYGIRSEIDCPFLAQKQICLNKDKDMLVLRIESFTNIDKEDEEGIIEVLKKQTIGAAVLITPQFKNYHEGIYEADEIYPEDLELRTHAVLLIGCGTDKESGKNFWLIQNSWGTDWGMNGYAKIMRNSSLPVGRKPILARLSYPANVEPFLCSKEQVIEYCPTRKKNIM